MFSSFVTEATFNPHCPSLSVVVFVTINIAMSQHFSPVTLSGYLVIRLSAFCVAEPHDVRVQIRAVGICGSDVHFLKVSPQTGKTIIRHNNNPAEW